MQKYSKTIMPSAFGSASVIPFIQWKYFGLEGWELVVTPTAIILFAFLMYTIAKKIESREK